MFSLQEAQQLITTHFVRTCIKPVLFIEQTVITLVNKIKSLPFRRNIIFSVRYKVSFYYKKTNLMF